MDALVLLVTIYSNALPISVKRVPFNILMVTDDVNNTINEVGRYIANLRLINYSE